jgi:folate-binding protein YgfZ
VDTATVELDAQYRLLREGAGAVERRDLRRIAVSGSEAADYLQGQLTNEVEALEPGQGCYSALLNRKGHLQGDMRVLRLGPDAFSIETEEVALDAVLRHLQMYKIGRDVEVDDVSDESRLLSVIGPGALEVAGCGPLRAEHGHREHELGGVKVRAVATDLGVDVLAPAADAGAVGEALRDAGGEPVSERAAEIVRVESGRPRFGREMTTATMPAEAGIEERAVSFTKGCYIGQEPVARLHYKGRPNRHLRGLRLSAPAASGDELRLGEKVVGRVGSAVVSPRLGPIALAIARREAEPGATLAVGDGSVTATVVELPFG